MEYAQRILIAEDNPSCRRYIETCLRKAGFEVLSVANGQEALERLKKVYFPIVITDWMMPEVDGLELCQTIRNLHLPGYVYLIILTARNSLESIVKGFEAGADEYLTKPVRQAELLARLKTATRILELEDSLKRQNEEMRALSFRDQLTGIYNRLFMLERLPQEVERACRHRHPLSLIMCDIDHFKRVNDLHGHRVGDLVLREFVDCLGALIREGVDWMVRYGGEEFLIVLPETGLEAACTVAERLRLAAVEKILSFQGSEIQITASFGVSCRDFSLSQNLISGELLIEQADRCLYQAKKEGRNGAKGAYCTEEIYIQREYIP
jgi:diguanylate cyclase (GGDEF)-like protein